jgi:hypothetical protein
MENRYIKFGKDSKSLVSIEDNTIENFESFTTENLNLVDIFNVQIEKELLQKIEKVCNSVNAPKLHDSENKPDNGFYVYLDGTILLPCI